MTLTLISPRDSLLTDLLGLVESLNWAKRAEILAGSGSGDSCGGETVSNLGECVLSLESSSKVKGSGLAGQLPNVMGNALKMVEIMCVYDPDER